MSSAPRPFHASHADAVMPGPHRKNNATMAEAPTRSQFPRLSRPASFAVFLRCTRPRPIANATNAARRHAR